MELVNEGRRGINYIIKTWLKYIPEKRIQNPVS